MEKMFKIESSYYVDFKVLWNKISPQGVSILKSVEG